MRDIKTQRERERDRERERERSKNGQFIQKICPCILNCYRIESEIDK